MNRTFVNPWPWSLNLGYSQGVVVQQFEKCLFCAGQTAVDANGAPRHEGDIRGQFSLAVQNLETVLDMAGMSLAHVVSLRLYATDVDELLRHFDVLSTRLAELNVAPPMTLLGVPRLALPSLMVELEATAAN